MWSIPDDDGELTVMMMIMIVMMISLQVTTSPEWEAVTIPPRARLTSAPSTQQTQDVEKTIHNFAFEKKTNVLRMNMTIH